jgi:hypothetical protein
LGARCSWVMVLASMLWPDAYEMVLCKLVVSPHRSEVRNWFGTSYESAGLSWILIIENKVILRLFRF